MEKLKITIIGQWIYPQVTPRAHRTWQLAKCFAKMGHDVTVYALLGKTDYSELEKKHNLKIRNLGKSWFGNSRSDTKTTSIISRAIGKILGSRFQFPHIEFKRLARKLISSLNEEIDILITIAAPHPIHWGAAQAMPKRNIKFWIADCGDPFMLNPFHKSPAKYEKDERAWCEKVDAITIPIENGRDAYYKEYHNKIHIIPQGFDFTEAKIAEYIPNRVPTFAFSGAAYPGLRDPIKFLKFLKYVNFNFKFVVYTPCRKHFEPYATLLGNKFEFRDLVPRNTLINELSKMDFLINIENYGGVQQPSKLIDYGQAGRPILSITSNFGKDEEKNFLKFIKGDYSSSKTIENLDKFDIYNICKQFVDLYNR